jgi:hypothetical protein
MNLPSGNFRRRAVATFALLAMLVAPLCASLCGSRVCASSSIQGEDCHSSLAASDHVPRTGVASIRVCGSQEFPAAMLNEASSSPDKMEKDSAVCASSNQASSQCVHLAVSDACYSRADHESFTVISSGRRTILRI